MVDILRPKFEHVGDTFLAYKAALGLRNRQQAVQTCLPETAEAGAQYEQLQVTVSTSPAPLLDYPRGDEPAMPELQLDRAESRAVSEEETIPIKSQYL